MLKIEIVLALKIVYCANILVAGWISLTCLFQPEIAVKTVFSDALQYSESIRLVGALWLGIFILSILGLLWPQKMSLILLFQLIYKGSWLLLVALPVVLQHNPYPKVMALFFLIWVIILPFVIPWKYLFS